MVDKLKIILDDKNKVFEILKVELTDTDGIKIKDIDKAVDPILWQYILQLDLKIDDLIKRIEDLEKIIGKEDLKNE